MSVLLVEKKTLLLPMHPSVVVSIQCMYAHVAPISNVNIQEPGDSPMTSFTPSSSLLTGMLLTSILLARPVDSSTREGVADLEEGFR